MILHRSSAGVLTADGLSVVLRALPDLLVPRRATVADFRDGKLDDAILEAFDLAALVAALARDVVDQCGLPMRRTTFAEQADRPSVQRTWSFGRGDARAIWIRGRNVSAMAGSDQHDASFDAYLAAGFPIALREAFGPEVVDAVRAAVLALRPLPCLCHTGVETIAQHDTLETLASKSDPRAPIDVGAAVARCTVCHQGWLFEWSGDSHYSYSYSAREFAPHMGFGGDEVDRILAGIRAGAEVVVGGSRCHTTYRARAGELVAEDFDEGMTEERACYEPSLREVIADDPESFLDVLRRPLRAGLRDALLLEHGANQRDALSKLLAYGECLSDPDLLAAVLAWPDERPAADALASLTDGKTGLDVYHAIMSALGYDCTDAAAGAFGLRFFSVIVEMLGPHAMPHLRRYRASFRTMAGDPSGALADLESD